MRKSATRSIGVFPKRMTGAFEIRLKRSLCTLLFGALTPCNNPIHP